MVQCHTHCSMSHCLKKKSNELKCRFHFPFDLCPQTKLQFENVYSKGDSEHYRATIVTKRNECITFKLLLITMLVFPAKYAAKSEPRSPILKEAFNSIVQNIDCNTDPRRAIKKVVMKSLGETDYVAQETMHHLLSLNSTVHHLK